MIYTLIKKGNQKMRLRTKLITSFLTIAVLLSSFSLVAAFDEGMYTPDQIAKLPLKQKGLKINPRLLLPQEPTEIKQQNQ